MIALTPHWKVLAGAALRQHGRPTTARAAGATVRKDNVWSYRTGIIYQPTDTQSYYASYGTSFNPSAEPTRWIPLGSNTPPEKSRNMEIGAKWDLLDGDLMFRTALFRSEKTNERNTDLEASPNEYLLSGKRHTDGIEFEVAGRITPDWEVFGGVRADARQRRCIEQRQPGACAPDNTPKYTANLWTTYRLAGGWQASAAASTASASASCSGDNTRIAPGYTRWDALVEYSYDK